MTAGAAAQSIRLVFRVPAERLDELIAELWSLGNSGVQQRSSSGEELVEAYFEPRRCPGPGELRPLRSRRGATLVEKAFVEGEDWLASYRARAQPMTVGPFVVDPGAREPGVPSAAGERRRWRLWIPVKRAFGTGSHESTRLILEGLPEVGLVGRTVLDIGTGSGILAFASLRLGARKVVAIDRDTESVLVARNNSRFNELKPLLAVGRADSLSGRFDVILLNILPEHWLRSAAGVVDRLHDGGEMLVSGLLTEQRPAVVEKLEQFGLEVRASRSSGEWTALHLAREGCP